MTPDMMVLNSRTEALASHCKDIESFCRSTGITPFKSTSYHLASNGILVETVVQTLKRGLKKGWDILGRLQTVLMA